MAHLGDLASNRASAQLVNATVGDSDKPHSGAIASYSPLILELVAQEIIVQLHRIDFQTPAIPNLKAVGILLDKLKRRLSFFMPSWHPRILPTSIVCCEDSSPHLDRQGPGSHWFSYGIGEITARSPTTQTAQWLVPNAVARVHVNRT